MAMDAQTQISAPVPASPSGAAARKPPRERRTEQVKIRLTVLELKALREAADAADMTLATYVRHRATGARIVQRKAAADAAIVTELNKIGVNLNQLTRATHRGSAMQAFWREIGIELRKVLAKVASRYDT